MQEEQPKEPALEAPPLFAAPGEVPLAPPGPDAPPPSEMPPSLPVEPPSYWTLAIIAGTSLALDLGSKLWAKEVLSGPNRRSRLLNRMHVIPDHLDFIFAQNPGGAWSFMRSVPEGLRRPFFLIVSASAIVFIISIYRRVRPEQWGMRWGLPFALGGAFGNLVDRIRYGWVVDFVDVYMKQKGEEHHWPTFNVADIAIVIGVALMGYEMMRPRRSSHVDGPRSGSGAASIETPAAPVEPVPPVP